MIVGPDGAPLDRDSGQSAIVCIDPTLKCATGRYPSMVPPREYLEYQAIARVQGTEVQAPAPVILNDAHERLKDLLRRAAHRPEQLPE